MQGIEDPKVKFNERRHLPEYRTSDLDFEYCKTLVPGEIGRIHYRGNKTEKPYRSGKIRIENPVTIREPVEGKKYIPVEQCADEIANQRRRYFPTTKALDTEVPSSLPVPNWTRKHTVYNDDGSRASCKSSKEYVLETDMTRKQRIDVGDLSRQRNFIDVASKGDKSYKIVDHESGYYAKGGLVAGSTIALKKSAKPVMKSTLVMKDQQPTMRMTFSEKVQNNKIAYEKGLINSLTCPGEKLGQEVPSWEQRTGCFLVVPEEEAY